MSSSKAGRFDGGSSGCVRAAPTAGQGRTASRTGSALPASPPPRRLAEPRRRDPLQFWASCTTSRRLVPSPTVGQLRALRRGQLQLQSVEPGQQGRRLVGLIVSAPALSSSFFSDTDRRAARSGVASTSGESVRRPRRRARTGPWSRASGVTALESSASIVRAPRPFICSKYAPSSHVAQEEHALQRLDVGAGGDHVDGDGDPQGRRVAELRRAAASGSRGLVGDLRGEVVALAEHLADRAARSPRRGCRPWRRSASSAPSSGRGRSR